MLSNLPNFYVFCHEKNVQTKKIISQVEYMSARQVLNASKHTIEVKMYNNERLDVCGLFKSNRELIHWSEMYDNY